MKPNLRKFAAVAAVAMAMAPAAAALAASPERVALLGVSEGAPKDPAGKEAGSKEAPSSAEKKKEPGYKDALAAVVQISEELKRVDAKLQSLDKSVASIDHSLASVSGAIKPEGINVFVTRATDVAFERAQFLVLMVTGCLAALIVLHALLRRYLR